MSSVARSNYGNCLPVKNLHHKMELSPRDSYVLVEETPPFEVKILPETALADNTPSAT